MNIRGSLVRIFARPRSWFRSIACRCRLEQEMEAELAHHIESLTADLIRTGQSPAEAARDARIALGSSLTTREGMRSSLGLRWWDELWADLRYGVRILRKSPGFTAIATTSLALAIGANTTIYSVANQLLYERLAVPHPEQLRLLGWAGDKNTVIHRYWKSSNAHDARMTNECISYPVFRELQAHNNVMDGLFAFRDFDLTAVLRGEAQPVATELVSGNYFTELRVRPQLGRAIHPSDDGVPGTGAVAMISDGLWQRTFGRSPAAVGQTIKLSGFALTIVGVTPRGFTGAGSVQESPDVFVPLSMQPLVQPATVRAEREGGSDLLADPEMWWLEVMGRIRPGVQDVKAQSALDVQLAAAIRGTMTVGADEAIPHMILTDGSRGLHYYTDSLFEKPVYALLALTGLVLLLACANIANLLLARGVRRQQEMSVRQALGAGRGRILRQLLTENLLLAALGGACGFALGYLGRNVPLRLMTNAWQQNDVDIHFDWRVFGLAGGVTILTAILFGLAPAWLAARTEVGSSLKEGVQTATRRRKGMSGKLLVAFQIALSTLLVVSAGLFLRTLYALQSVDVGFRTDHLLWFVLEPPGKRYPTGKAAELHVRLEQAFADVPGVEAVTAMSTGYLTSSMSEQNFLPEGEAYDRAKLRPEWENSVGDDFFHTMGIPIIAGRGFGPQDTANSTKVAVVNQSLARTRFPGVDPIGKHFKYGAIEKNNWIQIVGICGDNRFKNIRDDAPPQFLVPYVQTPQSGFLTYAVRTSLVPTAVVPALQQVLHSVDSGLPMIDIRTQQEQVDADTRMERTFASLTSGFGLLALVLACVGIYGIMAYSVANRRNEIGIRLALGAQPGQVRRMILCESIWLAGAGIIVGVATTLGLTRLVKSMLYGIEPNDPITIAGAVLILFSVTVAASWIPAHRAASVQPTEALRHE
ncbi:MAG: ABC transporter permease [Terracidiphilus sp.]